MPGHSIALLPPSHSCCAARYIRYIYNRVILENATVRTRGGRALPAEQQLR